MQCNANKTFAAVCLSSVDRSIGCNNNDLFVGLLFVFVWFALRDWGLAGNYQVV